MAGFLRCWICWLSGVPLMLWISCVPLTTPWDVIQRLRPGQSYALSSSDISRSPWTSGLFDVTVVGSVYIRLQCPALDDGFCCVLVYHASMAMSGSLDLCSRTRIPSGYLAAFAVPLSVLRSWSALPPWIRSAMFLISARVLTLYPCLYRLSAGLPVSTR